MTGEKDIASRDGVIPPAVFDYLKTLSGHIVALRATRQQVESLRKQLDSSNADTLREVFPELVHQVALIRDRLDEHLRRFQYDFSPPEEPPLDEVLPVVMQGWKQYPSLDEVELAWKLHLTLSITQQALRKLQRTGQIRSCRAPGRCPCDHRGGEADA